MAPYLKPFRIGESTDTKLKTDATARNLFEKEYMFMSHLDNPNVVQFLGVCKTATTLHHDRWST